MQHPRNGGTSHRPPPERPLERLPPEPELPPRDVPPPPEEGRVLPEEGRVLPEVGLWLEPDPDQLLLRELLCGELSRVEGRVVPCD